MEKRVLAKIPCIDAPEGLFSEVSKTNTRNAVIAQVYGQKNELLILYLFDKLQLSKGVKKPKVRMFINNNNYITQDLSCQTVKWLTGVLIHYLDGWYGYSNIAYLDKVSMQVISEFYGVQIDCEQPLKPIVDFQNNYLSKRLAEKHRKITDRIDAKMENIPALPSEFTSWVDNDVLLHSRYIYYQYSSKVHNTGYCTHCKNTVELYKPKHNQQIICTACNSLVTLKSKGKSTQVYDTANACILQKLDDGFLVRYFSITKKYYNHYTSPTLNCYEVYRDFYNKDFDVQCFEYGTFKQRNTRWIDAENQHANDVVVYPHDIYTIEKECALQYTGLALLANRSPNFAFNIEKLICDCKKHISISEKLVKVGLYRLAKDYLNTNIYSTSNVINYTGGTINQMLRVFNDDAKILIDCDVTMSALSLFCKLREQGKRLNQSQLSLIINCNIDCATLYSIANIVPIGKVIKYLSKQNAKDKTRIYRDYLESCKDLKYDISNSFVAFPNNLVERHDLNVEILNDILMSKNCKTANYKYYTIQQISNTLNQTYYFEDETYLIRAPIDAGEIIKEGHSLHHCVGGSGYLSRMASKTTVILFLRKKDAPDKSYYTLEMNTNRIVQCHTYKNKDKDKAQIKSFLGKWESYLRNNVKLNSKSVDRRRKVV